MIGKLLTWLVKRLFGIRYQYFELRDGRYLKVKRGNATIIDVENVPEQHQREQAEIDSALIPLLESVRLARQLPKSDRLGALKSLDPFSVLEKASKNSLLEKDVLKNPELVDADSPFEAQLKLDLVEGNDISEKIESNSEVSEEDVEEMLDTDFLAKWGYNKYGDDLADKINEGDTDPEGEDVGTSDEKNDVGDVRWSESEFSSSTESTPSTESTLSAKSVSSADSSSSSGNSASEGNSMSTDSTREDGNSTTDGNDA